MTDAKEVMEKVKEYKQRKEQDEFEKVYKEYKKSVKSSSGGLVKTNKADFIKMYAFYVTVIDKAMVKMWNTYLGK